VLAPNHVYHHWSYLMMMKKNWSYLTMMKKIVSSVLGAKWEKLLVTQ